jgi:hypothetical protein
MKHNPYFNKLIQQMQSCQEDLAIAYANGRQRDEWLIDREREIAVVRAEINRIWPIQPGRGDETEDP